jgi:hypothetical protein
MTTQDKLAQALRDILDPIAYLERQLQEGERLNGAAALAAINSREFYSRIAREALAAQQAEREPLTDEQISELHDSVIGTPYFGKMQRFARAIERAHGIGNDQS